MASHANSSSDPGPLPPYTPPPRAPPEDDSDNKPDPYLQMSPFPRERLTDRRGLLSSCLGLAFIIWLAGLIIFFKVDSHNMDANYKIATKYYRSQIPADELRIYEKTMHWMQTHKPPLANPKLDKMLHVLICIVPWAFVPMMALAGFGLWVVDLVYMRYRGEERKKEKQDVEEGIELEDWTGHPPAQPKSHEFRDIDLPRHSSGSSSSPSGSSLSKDHQHFGIVFPLSSFKFDKDAIVLEDVKSDGLNTEVSIGEGQWSDVEGDHGVGIEAPEPVRLI